MPQTSSRLSLPLLFLHFHKSGGTAVCSLLKSSGFRVTGPDTPMALGHNCNCRSLATLLKGNASGVDVEKYYAENKVDACFMEMADAWPSPWRLKQIKDTGFNGIVATMLRDPFQRFLSNFERDFFLANEKGILGQQVVPAKDWTLEMYASNDISPSYKNWGIAVPNYLVRSLIGRGQPNGSVQPSVTMEDLSVAKQALRVMDVVLILEDLRPCSIKYGFGTEKELPDVSNNPYSTNLGNENLSAPSEILNARRHSKAYREAFIVQNALDYELYNWALSRQRCGSLSKGEP